jgi:hypothetical protein
MLACLSRPTGFLRSRDLSARTVFDLGVEAAWRARLRGIGVRVERADMLVGGNRCFLSLRNEQQPSRHGADAQFLAEPTERSEFATSYGALFRRFGL